MVPLIAIMAIERRPPRGQEALPWVLLTNMSVDNLEQAIEKVQWYSKRWNIEVYHKVLKSGCGIEKAQLGSAERLKKYVALKSIVAWRLIWLSRLNDEDQSSACDNVLSKEEWSILYRKINKTKPYEHHKKSRVSAKSFIELQSLAGILGEPLILRQALFVLMSLPRESVGLITERLCRSLITKPFCRSVTTKRFCRN